MENKDKAEFSPCQVQGKMMFHLNRFKMVKIYQVILNGFSGIVRNIIKGNRKRQDRVHSEPRPRKKRIVSLKIVLKWVKFLKAF